MSLVRINGCELCLSDKTNSYSRTKGCSEPSHIHLRTHSPAFLEQTSCFIIAYRGSDHLEMADLPHRCHGNFPQRRTTPLPRAAECRIHLALEAVSSETGSDLASAAEEPKLPAEHPVVSLVRLPRQTQAELHSNMFLNRPQENGFSQNEADILEIREDSPESKPAEIFDLSQPETTPTSWTEPYCPDSSPSEEPEQDSGFDCESNPDQPYILFDSGGDWVCTLCRSDQDPVEAYDCENMQPCGGIKAPYTLSNQDQRRCEKLTLLLYCHLLSAPFHEPVSPLARNYYQIIKRPIDLSVIRRKLDKTNTLHYFSAEQFVDDVLLMFKNCATFNYPDSEVAQAGRNLEVFFLSKLKEIFPDRTFPSASQERTDRARLRWLNRKRKENYRKKRYMFSGKKYFL
ncbi:transcription intermediary factor 1-alpha-like protein [Lates japonicus]|uniref:Transcription intermediary factor 1-alpha-like protein n=1 Tax=Lates japonicus TaxID=270547 RepID=A0AAD3MWM7_LATJO|nr:transcription intermediary factor 1-alpha-like protein [Lates japonicus]